MLSGVLNTERAIQVHIQIIRIFIKLRKIINENKDFIADMQKVKKTLKTHENAIIRIIEQMGATSVTHKKRIGFKI